MAWPLLAGCLALILAAPAGAQHSGALGESGVASSMVPTEPVLEIEILPGDVLPNDGLGSSSDVQGKVMVICASGSDTIALNAGAAYVYRRNASGWQPEVKLAPNDLQDYDRFGYTCALDGDVLAIGAPNHGALGDRVGTVYVYR